MSRLFWGVCSLVSVLAVFGILYAEPDRTFYLQASLVHSNNDTKQEGRHSNTDVASQDRILTEHLGIELGYGNAKSAFDDHTAIGTDSESRTKTNTFGSSTLNSSTLNSSTLNRSTLNSSTPNHSALKRPVLDSPTLSHQIKSKIVLAITLTRARHNSSGSPAVYTFCLKICWIF